MTGSLQNGTHTIEKVIFESLPGFYVTGNLYTPNTPGRYPAVLVPSGHTQEGKPETQTVAANLAAKGFIALSYDPIGQGEREQTDLPQLGRCLLPKAPELFKAVACDGSQILPGAVLPRVTTNTPCPI